MKNLSSIENFTSLYSSEFHHVARKSDAGRSPKGTDREKRLIQLDERGSLADLARYVNTNFNLSISRSTIQHDLVHRSRITPRQRRNRLTCCYDHPNWSINHWSNVIFSTLKFFIESLFVDSVMIKLDLNDHKMSVCHVYLLTIYSMYFENTK